MTIHVANAESEKSLTVAVAGLGVVGGGAALRLAARDCPHTLAGALARDLGKPRDAALGDALITSSVEALLSTRPDAVIDALPDAASGVRLTLAAFAQGVPVISANKQAVIQVLTDHPSAHGDGPGLLYSAAVGGGAPMIETARKARNAGRVTLLEGVFNGTVNFILTRLKRGDGFAAAVKAAQAAGFAEPDPSADLSGDDVRAKLGILCRDAFTAALDPDRIDVEPLTETRAEELGAAGGEWRHVGRIDRPGSALRASLRFERVEDDDLLAAIDGEENALRVVAADGLVFECRGKGAGREPTVDSLFGDLERIARAETV